MTRMLALLGILTVLATVGVVSIGSARNQLAVMDACEAIDAGDVSRALALSEGRTGPSETGRAAATCRCRALLASDASGACAELLLPLAEEGWAPAPPLAAHAIAELSDTGRQAEAAALARAAGRTHPTDVGLFRIELEVRGAVEPEPEVLRSLASRVPREGEAATRMRVALAQRQLHRADPPAALAALGSDPPAGSGAALGLWFDTLGIAHAMNDDLAATRASYARWEREGGDPREVWARHVLAQSISGLSEPGQDMVAALDEARASVAPLDDPVLEETLAIRLIFTLVASGRAEEAIARYDALRGRLGLEGIRRDELERARLGEEIAGDPEAVSRGRLRFAAPGAEPGSTLWIAPSSDGEPDAGWQRVAISGERGVEVERPVAILPVRWVLRDPDGAVRASGTAYPRTGRVQEIAIALRSPASQPPAASLERAPADGKKRVALVLLDCGDWPLVSYLRQRGELPVMSALLDTGYRAVLDSNPPLTAAALEALVWPTRRNEASLAGTFYRFGVELAGLESIGDNPFEWLSWVLPESADLFATIGADERSAANLLLAHGGVRGGRHGEVTGPAGVTRRLALGRARRPLDADEARRFPHLGAGDGMDTHYVQTMAAEFDVTEELLRENALDFLAVRIEPLDILTHAHFGDAAREGQDDAEGLLFDAYRYIDARLAGVHAQLDADDVLIVMSDHGIRTAMEHDRPAIFVATGAGVPHGRAPGRPSLRGVARVVTELLGIDTDWPRTGVAAWAGDDERRHATAPRD